MSRILSACMDFWVIMAAFGLVWVLAAIYAAITGGIPHPHRTRAARPQHKAPGKLQAILWYLRGPS